MKEETFSQCKSLFPEWADLSSNDFDFDDPKGFSSFTMGIRSHKDVQPPAVLYRRLEGKENAILNFETEKDVFLTLGANDIAAHCYHYEPSYRVEAFHRGRSLDAEDLFEPDNLRKIANELYKFHHLTPPELPQTVFFELLHDKWGKLAKTVLEDQIDLFPENEQQMCEELRVIYSDETLTKVLNCLPDGELTFCHNDTYHGNIMKLDTGDIRLVDFEFSCLNHKTYDFANLFAETVMQHKQPDYPYFKIAEPGFGDEEIGILIDAYLDNATFKSAEARTSEFERLVTETKSMIKMSDYKYAMAALPLAVDPIQKIRFVPYALARFQKFLNACDSLD